MQQHQLKNTLQPWLLPKYGAALVRNWDVHLVSTETKADLQIRKHLKQQICLDYS
jgi:hypothetical protein